MAGTDSDVSRLLGGSQDNGIKLRTSNTGAFSHIICCDGFDVDFNPTDNTQFIASVNATVHRLWNNGLNQTGNISPSGYPPHWFTIIKYHNSNGSMFFLGREDIFKTINGGSSFTNVGAAGNWAMAFCPSDAAPKSEEE